MFAVGIKSFPKQKREKMQETIKWKNSNAGKIQNFTFWALAKIHPYCLRILKSTGNHICLKFWFRFNLRKKKELLQIRQQKTQFGNSDPQNVNLLNLGKFSKDCSTRKKPGKKWIQKAWMNIRTEEGKDTVGTCLWFQLTRSTKRIRSQWLTPNKIRNSLNTRYAITNMRFQGVVVITSASHAEAGSWPVGINLF